MNVVYLKRLEAWMLKKGYSKTTAGIYTRCLRAIFNEVTSQGIIKRDKCYPFGRRLYEPSSSRNIKKALTLEDASKIFYCQPQCECEWKAKDFWLFSCLANGINSTDIAHLKFKNIDGDYPILERAKTENATPLAPRPITVFISDDLRQIIDYRGEIKIKSPNNYILPALEPNSIPFCQVELIKLFV